MGTRADFYVGRGKSAEWLGSIAWDGYPSATPNDILMAVTEIQFRAAVATLATRDDWTSPEDGWPWPWEDSGTTDYAYTFDGGSVWASRFGSPWVECPYDYDEVDDDEYRGPPVVFPNMKDRQNFTLGPRSGVLLFS